MRLKSLDSYKERERNIATRFSQIAARLMPRRSHLKRKVHSCKGQQGCSRLLHFAAQVI